MKPERVQILGSSVSAINMEQACSVVMEAVAARQKGYVCFGGVQLLTEAYEHADYRELLERALLVTPDGMPLVWLGRLQGRRHMTRVYGPDLMLKICAATVAAGRTHFLYGGNPGVAAELKATLEKRFPGIRIVGTHCPPFRPLNAAEEAEVIQQIGSAQPDIIWVGLGSPKQDRFMRDYLPKLDTTVMLGVGAAFDFLTGRVRQAPGWMQRIGMEWAFRVCCEPRRLAGRYFRNNPLFVWRLIRERIGGGSAAPCASVTTKGSPPCR